MKNTRTPLSLSFLIIFFMFCTIDFCSAEKFISHTQLITDSESIISSNQIFRLGFFSPGNVSNRYVGIWYNTLPGEKAVVWVANREKPVTDFSGVLRIHSDGNLVILDGKQNVIWTTNVSVAANSTIAELLDSGNLVLSDASSGGSIGNSLWESFENPTDTVLQDMKFGTNKKIGQKQVLVSWKTSSDPSKGSFRVELEPLSIPQVVVWNGSQRHWRTGPWDGRVFIGVDGMFSNYLNGFNLLRDDRGGNVYVFFSYKTYSLSTRFLLNPAGQLVFSKGKSRWNGEWRAPQTDCQYYGKCGSFGFCSSFSSPICTCLRGYQPKSTVKGNWSSGCIRKTGLQCEGNSTNGERTKEDGFLKYKRMKVPDFVYSEPAGNLDDCKQTCLANCSCTAYSYVSGIGCMSWHGNLSDMEKFSTDGVDLYIRVAHSELDKKINVTLIVTVTVLVGLFTVGLCMYIYWRWVRKQKDMQNLDELDLPMFNYEKLAVATNNFCLANKLGEGGFGSVYKGKLPSGEEIAVKRLSKSSGQGIEEFKNEVAVISGLQHRNLVRLLGFCIEGEEKMLIYEYMPNKSLDTFLFDPKRKAVLGWKMCFQIIEGIGRGIVYLHRDSRLRVIHRDLKPSNILLDKDLNPKIADFGMARIFGGDELQANTRRVVGTYGYMSPEYAMDGLFSEKSDVYSFGVLLLGIVTGMRNSNCNYHEESLSLKEHVWKLWNKDKSRDIIDPTISEPLYVEEILRCLQVGLLCVQDFANDRPTMSSNILMLTSESAALPTPKRPVFSGRQGTPGSDSSYSAHAYSSGNNISITTLEGR